ncbi:hypothetical protein [Hymenobacter wooponensis]|uniref:Uncharacterized protein n=1 Tax=Hymenobacter wooponensis TaxID=1525360 RepID=A0A4Z0MEK6_9BACT|nr:hypothetical protein [Hymenobacter wooponensis]TGD77944.1 hypothetical protein EU557_21890 [Hymenobacter wooponensis]
MRKTASLQQPIADTVRLMLHEDEHGAYLFGYKTLVDAGCQWDTWFETIADAEEAAFEQYGVSAASWVPVADPLPECQHDWIAPVRVKGRSEGTPSGSYFEKLVDGQWVPFDSLF